jgi:transcriptional regulator with XRE-family HTH domain
MDRQPVRQTLGEAINVRRREFGWSQEELAHRMNDRGDVTFRQSDVSRLERGKVVLPHRKRLEYLGAVLGLSLGELLARSGWPGWCEGSATAAIVPADAGRPGDASRVAAAPRRSAEWMASGEPAAGRARLQEALARARRTVAQSEQVLKQAEKVRAIYKEPFRGRRPRTAQSGTARESRAGETSGSREDRSHRSTARPPDSATRQ